MDHAGATEGPGQARRPSSSSSGTPMGAEGQTAQRPKVKITPFHSSPIASSDGGHRSKRSGAVFGKPLASPGSLFLDTPGGLTAPPVGQRLAASAAAAAAAASAAAVASASAGSPEGQTHSSGTLFATTGEKTPVVKPGGKKAPKSSLIHSQMSGPPSNTELCHSQKGKEGKAVFTSMKPQSAVKRKKRKMGMYNLVPKKKAKALKQQEKKEQPGACVEKNPAVAEEKPVILPETLNAVRNEMLLEVEPGDGSHVEYTELALDYLDLKAQEELLLPPLSGVAANAEVTETDLAEELPLCCCRMETPHSVGSLSTLDQTCMAMESMDGMLSRCQRRVMKQEMMRPSNTVHLLVLCEDHRAGMVKHQCCPGCGLFCRAGTFMECRPHGSISHRFHRDCASILKDLKFCPHCGEDASGAKEITMLKAAPSPSVPRSKPGPSLPAVPTVATLPSVPTTPAVPQILRAKKTSKPQRSRDESPSSLEGEAVCAADRVPKESLENILMALDDENLKPKKVKYPTRQLYISAKQGELQKVIHLLVAGKDPNFSMEGQNRGTPLHAAAAEGHQEICHMLVQVRRLQDRPNTKGFVNIMTFKLLLSFILTSYFVHFCCAIFAPYFLYHPWVESPLPSGRRLAGEVATTFCCPGKYMALRLAKREKAHTRSRHATCSDVADLPAALLGRTAPLVLQGECVGPSCLAPKAVIGPARPGDEPRSVLAELAAGSPCRQGIVIQSLRGGAPGWAVHTACSPPAWLKCSVAPTRGEELEQIVYRVGDVHCIDARLFGNVSRFINHLCEPNLLAVKVFTMHQDLRFPRISFFSSRPIKAGEQIGFDYGDHYWRVKSKYFTCQCGSLKCLHSAASR
ncbi:histone-lysine N-methyltransferase EHMT1-like [Micropterus salmoides]|uniref:histone-lysine N-methyltransferase EHMT1-like n=1 Tax=Micropterus salmoides TaxID=27706 RepID=UPI0018EBFC11|nr:histone-lysine N-methyltransferase EHMT1-like [Micropterus salmoides]